MSTSQSSEKKPSWHRTRETKTFKKFGMKFILCVMQEKRQKWETKFRDENGNELDLEDEETKKLIQEEKVKPDVSWEPVDDTIDVSYVSSVSFQDEEDCTEAKRIEVLSTPDGPILGIVYLDEADYVELLDPCLIQYDGKRITYKPIFNVARSLKIYKSAIRSRQAPAEVIIASYPGFILQNRMFMYQLKPAIPFAATPPVDNEANEDIVSYT